MDVIEQMAVPNYEQVIGFQNNATGLRGFLAIHNTTLGPAHGGTRVWRYASESDALADALRLSRAMTYKAAVADLPCGGGKAVILLHPSLKRSEAFRAFGQLVESLRGRFFTGPDVGTTSADLAAMGQTTHYVASESSPELGDLSQHTALGVWHGMRACLEFAGLTQAQVAIQGVGSVGLALGRILKREGIALVIADSDPQRLELARGELGARVLAPEEIMTASCEVLAPCALGDVVNERTIPRIRARIVCGCANNVLSAPEAGDELARRGIIYAPDYLVNAGGLIRGVEFYMLRRPDSGPSLARIYHRMRRVLEIAQERRLSTACIVDEMAEARLSESKGQREKSSGQG